VYSKNSHGKGTSATANLLILLQWLKINSEDRITASYKHHLS